MDLLEGFNDRGAAVRQFATYLVFDALIGNTDRHHENWAALTPMRGRRRRALAPSFDHGSSLGCGITDEERRGRLSTRDQNRTVEAYGPRARAHFADAPRLGRSVQEMVRLRPETVEPMRLVVVRAEPDRLRSLIDRLPPHRLGPDAKAFTDALVLANRALLGRLLECLP